jgi:hypothetical protein
MLAHSRRKVLHFNVTENPAARWTAQQIIEAFPCSSAPNYLLRDRDAIYGVAFQKRDVEAIRNGCVKRTLGLIEDLAEKQKDKYATFWNTFSKVLKEGSVRRFRQSRAAREARALAITASGSETRNVSLADYVGRMKEGQEAIYYVTADTFVGAARSPHLEILSRKADRVVTQSVTTRSVPEQLVAEPARRRN